MSFFPASRLQTVARHSEPCFDARRTKVLASPQITHHPGIAHPQ
jgi:hypothetical protein